ncbi:MAG: response regulator [Bacteroidota bacterium]
MIAKVAKKTTVRVLILAHRPDITTELIQQLPFEAEPQLVCEKYEFVRSILSFHPEVILVDGHLPCLTGTESLYLARKAYPNVPVIVLYDANSPTIAAEALMEGASNCLSYRELHHLSNSMKEAQEQHPEHSIDLVSRRIVKQIQQNLAGLDEIRDFFAESSENSASLYSEDIKSEIERSIDYLEQLEHKMRFKAA